MSAPVDLKLVLLGHKNVGKTSIFNRYVYDEFGPTSMTIGAYFGTKAVRIGEHTCNLAIWDTAGEEKFDSLTNFYCRNAGAALICYDLTSPDTFSGLSRWIDKIAQEADPTCQILLVANKLDALEFNPHARRVELIEAKRFADKLNAAVPGGNGKISVHEISAKTGEGVKEAFEALVEICVEKQLAIAKGGKSRGSKGTTTTAKLSVEKNRGGGGGGGAGNAADEGRGCC